MALNFNPSPYLEAFQYGQNRDQQARNAEAQGIQGIGQGIGQLAQIPAQQREGRMNELMTALKLKEQGIDPSNAMNYLKTGQFPSQPTDNGSSLSPNAPLMPSFQPPTSNQNTDPGWGEGRIAPSSPSPIVAAHKQVLMDPNHPYRPQAAQQPAGMGSLLQTPNVDIGDVIDRMTKGDYSGWQKLPSSMQSKVEADPRYKQLVKQPKPDDLRTPEQVQALFPHLDPKALASAYPKGIPKEDLGFLASGMRIDSNLNSKDTQLHTKRLQQLSDALDPSKQRQGAFGVSKQVFDRAERLESLAGVYQDGNLDSRQMEELAIGLNSMLSGSNTGAQQQVSALVPKTIWGDAQKLKEWFLNDPQGTQQQEFVKRMLSSVSREKQTAVAQMNRTRFSRIASFTDLEKSNTDAFNDVLRSHDVDPDEYHAWKSNGYKTLSAVQVPNEGTSQSGVHQVQVGEVYNGFRYRGGDRAQQSSWEKIQ